MALRLNPRSHPDLANPRNLTVIFRRFIFCQLLPRSPTQVHAYRYRFRIYSKPLLRLRLGHQLKAVELDNICDSPDTLGDLLD